jgi:endonuclease/exonuclease/phosphatase family metal-dependent hydrolase
MLQPFARRVRALFVPPMDLGSIPMAHDGRPRLTVASYNIHKCVGTDGRRDPARVADVILELDADVVALQEADMRFGARNGLLDMGKLRELGGYRYAEGLGSRSASHGWHGNVVLYREGLVQKLHKIDLPGLEPRGAIVLELEYEGVPVRIIAAHLGLLRRSREQQVSLLLQAADPADHRAVIVVGDMNEWRLGRRSALKLFEPHFGPIDQGVASFPSRFPLWSLDRVLVSRNMKVLDVEAHATKLAQEASDHLPVRAIVELPHRVAAHVPAPMIS